VYDLLKKNNNFINIFKQLKITEDSKNELEIVFDKVEEFICQLYGFKVIKDVNKARVAAFMKIYNISNEEDVFKQKKHFDRSLINPSKAEIREHLKRTAFIVTI